MFEKDYKNLSQLASTKITFFQNNPIGYFFHSILAGLFIGIGILLVFSVSAQLSKMLKYICFSALLILLAILILRFSGRKK